MKATDAHYRRIVETAREGIWTIDTEGRTTFANQRMAEILGTTLDTLLSEHSFSWVFEEDREAAAELFDFKKQGDKRVFEFRLRRQDGSPISGRAFPERGTTTITACLVCSECLRTSPTGSEWSRNLFISLQWSSIRMTPLSV